MKPFWPLILCCLALSLPGLCRAEPEAFDPAVLSATQYLYLNNGSRVEGRAQRWEGDTLVMVAQRGGGEVEYRFEKANILRLSLPGSQLYATARSLANEEKWEDAVACYRALWESRAPWLALLVPEEIEQLMPVAEINLNHGDPYLAVAAARLFQDHVARPDLLRELQDLELLATYRLPIKSDAQALAEAWIADAEPYGPSALGYFVLGQLALESEEPEEALRYALTPVAFSGQFPMDYLEHCYALGIGACLSLKLEPKATLLAAEMHQRGLSWPPLPELAAHESFFHEVVATLKTLESPAAPDLP